MAQWIWKVLLLTVGLHCIAAQDDPDEVVEMLTRCCQLGKLWKGRGACGSYPTPLAGVPEANQTVCVGTLKMCCAEKGGVENQADQRSQARPQAQQANRLTESRECAAGRNVAQRTQDCVEISDGESNAKKDCCNCCKLGLMAHSLRARCDVTNHGTYCDKSFRECCQRGGGGGSGNRPNRPLSGQTCATTNPCQHRCIDTGAAIRCECRVGYELMSDERSCRDINECLEGNTCRTGERCANTAGSYRCIREASCGTGYTLNANTNQCEDDDECTVGNHNCGRAFECINTPGSFRCRYKTCPTGTRLSQTGECETINCGTGMQPNNEGLCVDINECQQQGRSPCGPGQICENTSGSYRCRDRCQRGYRADSQGLCRDVNECEDGTADCPGGQQCQNTPGSYQCACDAGYDYDQRTRTCVDVNECQRYGQICSVNAKCENTRGSYTCVCKDGFKLASDNRNCVDVNECESSPGLCQHNCLNTWGSYQCTCQDGYKLSDNKRTCIDIDECAEWGTQGALCVGTCQNTPGSYTCVCPDGYRMKPGDNRICEDIDECFEGTASCSGPDQVCINTRGGFKCNTVTCPNFFIKAPAPIQRQSRQNILSDDGIICIRRPCMTKAGNPTDFECIMNKTKTVTYQFLALPSLVDLPLPTGILRVSSILDGAFFYPNLRLLILSGNDGGVFSLKTTSRTRGLLSVIKPVRGPKTFMLKLALDNLNDVGHLLSRHIAYVDIDISRYSF